MGESLTRVGTESSAGGEHFRLLVVVRPEILLGNLLPDDVVYEIVAQAPVDAWDTWEPIFEVIFQSFQPLDCGGV